MRVGRTTVISQGGQQRVDRHSNGSHLVWQSKAQADVALANQVVALGGESTLHIGYSSRRVGHDRVANVDRPARITRHPSDRVVRDSVIGQVARSAGAV